MSSIFGGVAPTAFGGSGGPANEGIDFVANHTGVVTGISWYMPAAGGPVTITGILYDTQTQAAIASVTVAGAGLVAGAWNVIPFAAPVAVTPGKVYTASVFITTGTNGFTLNGISNYAFASDLTGIVRTGRFDNGAVAAFPTSRLPDAFGVDVAFTQTQTCPDCPPTNGFLINLTSPGFINIVTGVGRCVIDALAQTPAGAPCRQCLLVPSDTIVMDNCGCGPESDCTGQVALAIRGVYGSDIFPAPASGKAWTQCTPRYQVVRASVQVTRCVPTLDDGGQPPTCDEELAAAVTLENDRTAIRQAIACCLNYAFQHQQPYVGTWLMNESLTIGEQGGCAGVLTEFLVGVQACPCPG